MLVEIWYHEGDGGDHRNGAEMGKFGGFVVAIGASAGGLEALEHFFRAIPNTPTAAFVVIQHLSPDFKSMMQELVARYTDMPVVMVENHMPLSSGHVFLLPAGRIVELENDRLRLKPAPKHDVNWPIDTFFASMAKSIGTRSIGVVLSGTGTEGTRGAAAINEVGGVVLAQDPLTAKFDGMPRSAIASGFIDGVLGPADLGKRVVAIIKAGIPVPHVLLEAVESTQSDQQAVDGILQLLHGSSGINFRYYKRGTLLRRVERRVAIRGATGFSGYLQLLKADPPELALLRRQILIPVTKFFRDPEAFAYLETHVIPAILADRGADRPVRVWVPGVSTGEEAYSLAILFAEAFEANSRWPPLKIFATDVEQQYIDFASVGRFSESIEAEVSPDRLARFFDRVGHHYQVKNEIRRNIIFARQNLLEDAPITRMDLVSCRNVLIYFLPSAQEQALRRMQYALAPNGYLFLGTSESLGDLQPDFEPISLKYKIFRLVRQQSAASNLGIGTSAPVVSQRRNAPHRRLPTAPAVDFDSIAVGKQMLVEQYAPLSLVVNEKLELLHVFGDVHDYMQIPDGRVSFNITKLLAPNLAGLVAVLAQKALGESIAVSSHEIQLEDLQKTARRVRVVVRPLPVLGRSERYLMISLETETAAQRDGEPTPVVVELDAHTNARVVYLEKELNATRDALETTIEELETSNEELQATNEEMIASNEELQSTNEELQSVNEELYAINAEYQEKLTAINAVNATLETLTKAAMIPTIFIDDQLRIIRFTEEVTKIMHVRPSDVGRPIGDFASKLNYPEFVDDLKKTLRTAAPAEREVKSSTNEWYWVRVLPYVEPPSEQRRLVVTMIETTAIKNVQRLQAILDALPDRVAVLDKNGVVIVANQSWQQLAAAIDENTPTIGLSANLPIFFANTPMLQAGDTTRIGDRLTRLLGSDQPIDSFDCVLNLASTPREFQFEVTPISHPDSSIIIRCTDRQPAP